VDDVLEFPLPEDIARFDPRIRMPVFWLTVQVALSDIETEAHGPTQFVPGSHYSGRRPPTQENPTFEGRGPVPVFCKAGDIYLTNHQCWHRGAPNQTERPRDLITNAYVRPEIEKSHLMTPQTDGTSRYIPCTELMAKNPILHQLLKELPSTP
jgi:ectoine hydroxylase-related dioxygenase (phytanoyl-CoA dioxygenase family)